MLTTEFSLAFLMFLNKLEFYLILLSSRTLSSNAQVLHVFLNVDRSWRHVGRFVFGTLTLRTEPLEGSF